MLKRDVKINHRVIQKKINPFLAFWYIEWLSDFRQNTSRWKGFIYGTNYPTNNTTWTLQIPDAKRFFPLNERESNKQIVEILSNNSMGCWFRRNPQSTFQVVLLTGT